MRTEGTKLNATDISSGESELISLGIEILMFSAEIVGGKLNLLLLDEPDVHLHPDLQARLIQLLITLVEERDFMVVIATHSTAILGGLSDYPGATACFMQAGMTNLTFETISDLHRRVLPVFGAHPLSNIFNQAPVLIVEGEDDQRVWQQAVRTSRNAIRLYPVPCEGRRINDQVRARGPANHLGRLRRCTGLLTSRRRRDRRTLGRPSRRDSDETRMPFSGKPDALQRGAGERRAERRSPPTWAASTCCSAASCR